MAEKKGLVRRCFGWLALDSRPLYCQWSLWIVTVLVVSGIGRVTWLAVRDLPIDSSSTNVQNILKIISPILGLAGFGVAIIVLVARMHTTKQTHDQIVLTRQANTFNNFLHHLEHFRSEMSMMQNDFINAKESNFSVLYGHIFPENSPKYFSTEVGAYREWRSMLHFLAYQVNQAFEESMMMPPAEDGSAVQNFPGHIVLSAMSSCLQHLGIAVDRLSTENNAHGLWEVWDTDRLRLLNRQVGEFYNFLFYVARNIGIDMRGLEPKYMDLLFKIANSDGRITQQVWDLYQRKVSYPTIRGEDVVTGKNAGA